MRENILAFLLITLALIAANLPFLLDRPLLLLRCPSRGARARCGCGIVLLWAALACVAYLAQGWIGQSVAIGGIQSGVFFLRIVLLVAIVWLLLAIPAWWPGASTVAHKPFWQRLVECVVLYGLIGALGRAFEANLGNVFVPGWQFYAVTASLFLVMAYPGFVIRYLWKPKRKTLGKI